MAEVAALGLVTNIITFIDFGLKLISGVRSVREGATPEIHELDLIVADVRSSNTQVTNLKNSGAKLSNDEVRILSLVGECERVAKG